MRKPLLILSSLLMLLCCHRPAKQPHIALTVMTSAHPYFQAVIAEWQRLSQVHGFTLSLMDPNFDNARLMKIVEDLIIRRPDGIAFAPLDSRIAVKMLQKIKAAGIPVIAYNINPSEPVAPTVVGEDLQGGQLAGETAAEEWKKTHSGTSPRIGIVGQVGIAESLHQRDELDADDPHRYRRSGRHCRGGQTGTGIPRWSAQNFSPGCFAAGGQWIWCS